MYMCENTFILRKGSGSAASIIILDTSDINDPTHGPPAQGNVALSCAALTRDTQTQILLFVKTAKSVLMLFVEPTEEKDIKRGKVALPVDTSEGSKIPCEIPCAGEAPKIMRGGVLSGTTVVGGVVEKTWERATSSKHNHISACVDQVFV